MTRPIHTVLSVLSLIVTIAASTSTTLAADFASLQQKGFKVGKLTKSKAGNPGWNLSDGKTNYFCELGVAVAIVNNKKLVGFTSAGRTIPLDRKTYEAALGGSLPKMPKYSDLKKGIVTDGDVGPCHAVK